MRVHHDQVRSLFLSDPKNLGGGIASRDAVFHTVVGMGDSQPEKLVPQILLVVRKHGDWERLADDFRGRRHVQEHQAGIVVTGQRTGQFEYFPRVLGEIAWVNDRVSG
ncbi:MAG TPA: hypothetical protein VKE94_03395 [Gemmataceae bacterium]|nr:hypothetical protein [Gemmataceae bacterium]